MFKHTCGGKLNQNSKPAAMNILNNTKSTRSVLAETKLSLINMSQEIYSNEVEIPASIVDKMIVSFILLLFKAS